ncbi:MAG: acyl carrier protein, partial [Candidatus Hydrogenedentes bacterium]|nr:acyl carrier protein [Candidatus Hydrogenedentota bacterium]
AHSKVRAELLEVLLPMPPDERRKDIERRLLEKISGILKIPADRIDARKNISDLGIDSLVAVELTVALQRSLAVEITTVDLLGKPSVGDLANMILAQLISDEDALLANLDNLSEEDLDKLLQENADLETAR